LKSPLLAQAVARLALTKKAADVVVMDLRGLTSMTDFFVVCSADSDVQIRAIADAVDDGMITKGVSPWHRESGSSNWVLLDFVDVVVHIFHRNTRGFYNLEKLWGDAKITRAADDAPAPGVRTRPRAGTKPRAKKSGSAKKSVAAKKKARA
jgi:ribosome-associated protein